MSTSDGFRRQRQAKKALQPLTVSLLHECVLRVTEPDSLAEYMFRARDEIQRQTALAQTSRCVSDFWHNACVPSLDLASLQTVQAVLASESAIVDDISEARHQNNRSICELCGTLAYFTADGFESVCSNCGAASETLLAPHEFPGAVPFGTEFMPPSGVYKRGVHLNEFLLQIQGDCAGAISPEHMQAVREQLRKMRVEPAETTITLVRDALKRLGLSKLYEHSANILTQINGASSTKLSPELVAKLQGMFNAIQAPFERVARRMQRKNMLSYSYVIRKCCELLAINDLAPYLPLLKSRAKVEQLDAIWKEICLELGWDFIRSI